MSLQQLRDKTRFNLLGLGISGFDLFGTLGITYVISNKTGWSFWKTSLVALVLGELVHLQMNIDTPVTNLLKTAKEGDDMLILTNSNCE